MTTAIRHHFFYAHPLEAVWEYLTKAELLSQWLMPNDFELIIGYDFQFTTKPLPQFDCDGIFYCKIAEIVPFKKLSYSWKTGPGHGKISLDSLVVWTLVEKDNGTELQLLQSGFKEVENFNIYTAMTKGWFENMEKIAKYLNTPAHGASNT